MTRNCYCSLWDTNPGYLSDKGIPRGYCGVCERCDLPGHLRHAPAPVPSTGAWCDECFEIQLHRAPNIEVGAWHYDATTKRQLTIPVHDFSHESLSRLVGSLNSTRSSLIIAFTHTRWVDLYVLPNGSVEMSYADELRNKWAYGAVRRDDAVQAVLCGLADDDIETAIRGRDVDLEFYSE
jgi:hypothetical protein